MDSIIHGLLNECPLCLFIKEKPRHWPIEHNWHRIDRPEGITCLKCRAMLINNGSLAVNLHGIARKIKPQGRMEVIEASVVTVEAGLEGDCRGRGGMTRKRQVTLLSEPEWDDVCRELGMKEPWHARRANLLISELRFKATDLGRKLTIGNVVLQVTGETEPCNRMEDVCPWLKDTLSKRWRGGITCRVIKAGIIEVGDSVKWMTP